jgi:uncharacterized protein YcbK (DUF882 family)
MTNRHPWEYSQSIPEAQKPTKEAVGYMEPDVVDQSDPVNQQLTDDFANGRSEASLAEGTNSVALLNKTINNLTTAKDIFTTARSYSWFPDYVLIINDIFLGNATVTGLSIECPVDVFVGETLRSPAPVVTSEGKQDFILRLSLSFKPGEQQAVTLRRLISQLSKNPFTYIHSNDIKKKLGVPETETTIFALESANMRSTTETVGLILLELQFHYFNYAPFSRHYWYNAILPGYSNPTEEAVKTFKELEEIELPDYSGYEASAYSITKAAEQIRDYIRAGIVGIHKRAGANVPVNIPAASDAWMYYAEHLLEKTNLIFDHPSDNIGFVLRNYIHIPPPTPQEHESRTTLYTALNWSPATVSDIYKPESWPEETAETGGQTAQEQYVEDTADTNTQAIGKITDTIKFKNYTGGETLSLQLIDVNNNVIPESIERLTKFVDRREKEKGNGKFLKEGLLKHLAFIATGFPGKTIKVISAIRDYEYQRQNKEKPKNFDESKSNHPNGFAADIVIEGVSHLELWKFIARNLRKNAGLGYYPNSKFVHVDYRTTLSTYWIDASGPGQKANYIEKGTTNLQNVWTAVTGESFEAFGVVNRSLTKEEMNIEDENESVVLEEKRRQQQKQLEVQKDIKVADLIEQKQKELEEYKTSLKVKPEARKKWIEEMSKTGLSYYEHPKLRNIFYKDIALDVSGNFELQRDGSVLKNIVCSAISVNFGHRIAPMRLVGQSYYSYQFLGAGNKSGQMVFTFSGEEGKQSANMLKELFSAARNQSRDFGSSIQEAGVVRFIHTSYLNNEQNSILALLGVDYAIISGIEEATSPEGPNKGQLVVDFIAQEFAEEKYEQRFATTISMEREIIRALMKHMRWKDRPEKTFGGRVIFPDHQIVRFNTNKLGGKYKVVGDTPLWVAEIIAEVAEICVATEEKITPVAEKISEKSNRTWHDMYAEWGATFFKGYQGHFNYRDQPSTPYAQTPRNATAMEAFDRQVMIDDSGIDFDRIEGSLNIDRQAMINKHQSYAYRNWLQSMKKITRMVRQHLNDTEVMNRYFNGIGNELINELNVGLESSYADLDMPVVPGTKDSDIRLNPEFYIYDDAHEDPLLSSHSNPDVLYKRLKEHARKEKESIKHYLQDHLLAGGYLSKNLPRMLQASASEHKRSSGERELATYNEYFRHGATAWEPIYASYGDETRTANLEKWIALNPYAEGSNYKYLKALTNLPLYLHKGRGYVETSYTENDKALLVKNLYGKAENTLGFGPDIKYANVDKILAGLATTTAEDKKANTEEEERSREEDEQDKVDKEIEQLAAEAEANATGQNIISPSSEVVTFGAREEIKENFDFGKYIDELGDKPYLFSYSKSENGVLENTITNSFKALTNILINSFSHPFRSKNETLAKALAKNTSVEAGIVPVPQMSFKEIAEAHHIASEKVADEEDMIARVASSSALGKLHSDLSMRRAYPTFKIYFIEDDSGQTELVSKNLIRAFDDFYSYSAIQEIKIVRSRKIAADMAVIRMTNVGGKIFNYKFGDSDKKNKRAGTERQGIFAETTGEHPFEKLVMQEGVKVQIRLGYASNPDDLESVFLGQIVEVATNEKGKILEIACQGYGAELESVYVGPKENGDYFVSSQQVLSGCLILPSIINFGRQDKFAMYNPAEIRNPWTGGKGVGVLSWLNPATIVGYWADNEMDAKFNQYQFLNFPQDDNIYVPPPKVYTTAWERFWNNACVYRPISLTPWEIFQEHELRHPGYISLAVPYGHSPRMTMFFGSKMQHYWSRPPSDLEIMLTTGAKNDIVKIRRSLYEMDPKAIKDLAKLAEKTPEIAKALLHDVMTKSSRFDTGFLLGEKFGRYVPFRNYHHFDSTRHILWNEIRTSVDGTYNEIEVAYNKNEDNVIGEDPEEIRETMMNPDILAVKLDENIPENYIRSGKFEFPSCIGTSMAKRYVQGLFARHLRDSYKGELCIIGDEKVKPYDICYLSDMSVGMTGPIEVESVVHIFNSENGFVSIITPDLCLEVNDFYSVAILDVAAAGMTWSWGSAGSMSGIMGGAGTVAGAAMTYGALGATAAIGAGAAAAGLGIYGAFKGLELLGRMACIKFANFTQEGTPVIATPLTLGGRPFISNSLGSNKASFFNCIEGRWNQYYEDLNDAWQKLDIGEAFGDLGLDLHGSLFGFLGTGADGNIREDK